MTERSESGRMGLIGLAGIASVTVAWWALALWPPPGGPPAWLLRTRAVCFNAGPNGLPDASGWMLLIGQPIGMLALLMSVWGDSVRAGLNRLARSGSGRVVLAGSAVFLLAGAAAAGVRVDRATVQPASFPEWDDAPPETYPRIDRPTPAFSLVDQEGAVVTMTRFAGRPVLMTFAFGHCEAICPMVVHQTTRAQRVLTEAAVKDGRPAPSLLVVTLDPWRDTPSRLGHLAEQWELPDDAFAVSGSVEDVNALLDALDVPRERNIQTGDIVHPGLVLLFDADGTLAYASTGGTSQIVALAERL
jgi:cytochrome oxidase Cu insertion factor (SCO1/SenC/PrrC family)